MIFDARGTELVRRSHRQTLTGRDRRRAARRAARGASATARAAATRPAASSRGGRSRCRSCARRRTAPPRPPTCRTRGSSRAKDAGALTEFDRLTLHQAVTIVALELLRRRVADDTERRLAGDLLTALVSGELGGSDLARRLEPFGLGDHVGVLVLQPPRASKAEVEEALTAAVRDEAPGGLAAGTGTFSCALLPHGRGAEEEAFRLAERIRARVAREVGTELPAGAGRAAPAGELRRAFHEARCALEARALAGGDDELQRRRPAAAGDLPRPRLLPAPALAPGRRRAAAVLRLDPVADRGGRGRLRRRADALARVVHRVQRPVGEGGAPALLPPPYAALPDPPRRGAHRAAPWTPRATASTSGSRCAGASSSTERKDRALKVGVPTEIKTDEYRVGMTPAGRARAASSTAMTW